LHPLIPGRGLFVFFLQPVHSDTTRPSEPSAPLLSPLSSLFTVRRTFFRISTRILPPPGPDTADPRPFLLFILGNSWKPRTDFFFLITHLLLPHPGNFLWQGTGTSEGSPFLRPFFIDASLSLFTQLGGCRAPALVSSCPFPFSAKPTPFFLLFRVRGDRKGWALFFPLSFWFLFVETSHFFRSVSSRHRDWQGKIAQLLSPPFFCFCFPPSPFVPFSGPKYTLLGPSASHGAVKGPAPKVGPLFSPCHPKSPFLFSHVLGFPVTQERPPPARCQRVAKLLTMHCFGPGAGPLAFFCRGRSA